MEPEERNSVIVMSRIHKIAGLRISRVHTAVSNRGLLPDLEPPEERLRRQKTSIFLADSITLSHSSAMDDVFEPNLREEHQDVTARLTVYVLNLIVMVFAMPVGLALLCMNILGGENLRTTAHVLALTGMFMALGAASAGQSFAFL